MKKFVVFLIIIVFGIFVFNDAYAGITKIEESWSSFGNDQGGAEYGGSVALAGDVNGDGYSDILVGAPGYNISNPDVGKVYLYLGSASGLSSVPSWTSSGDNQIEAWYGYSLSSAGDVNGDGFDDVIIGAAGYDTPNSNAGKAYVYLGSASGLSSTPAWTSSGDDQAETRYGFSVSQAGDVNKDGFSDVVVGAIYYDTPISDAGKAYLYLGSASGLSSTPAWTSSGDNIADTYFGAAMTSAGDVNGDGFDDVLAGVSASTGTGKAFLYLGSANGLSTNASWTSSGDGQDVAWFGEAVSSAGDVNGDGFDDVIIGSMFYDTSNFSAGRAYLYLGSASGLSSTPSWTSSGDDTTYAYFGIAVSQAGDVNGDGFNDVMVGASGYNIYGLSNGWAGKVYLYLGSASGLNTIPSWTSIADNQIGARYGNAVSSAGDVNKDGYDDLVIGANTFDTSDIDAGKAYLYLNQAQFSVNINSDAVYSNSRNVNLALSISDFINPVQMMISENSDFAGAAWETYSATKSFILSSGDRTKTVYAKFKDANNDESKIVSDSIILAVNKAKFVTKSADSQKNEILIETKNKKYSIADFDLNFKKFPKKLQRKKYYLQVQKFKKYPKKYSQAKKTALKKYWKIKTGLNKYQAKTKKDKFKAKFIFKYTDKEWKALKKKNKSLKEKNLRLKHYNFRTKTWKITSAKHNKKKNTFILTLNKFDFQNNLFVIGKK